MITPAEFKARFPEYATLDDAYIQNFISDAYLELAEPRWGNFYNLGLYYLSAHYLYMAKKSANGQSVGCVLSSQSVGDVSVSYATPANVDQDYYLKLSSYGQRFLYYRLMAGTGGLIV